MNKNKIQSLIELARLDKPIGIYLLLWPSLLGLLLAGINSQISVIITMNAILITKNILLHDFLENNQDRINWERLSCNINAIKILGSRNCQNFTSNLDG